MKKILFPLILALHAASSVTGSDLLMNGHFEFLDGARPRNWSYSDMKMIQADSTEKHGGRYSMKLLPTQTYYSAIGYSGDIREFPKELILRGAVKYENVPENGFFIGIWTWTDKQKNSFSIPAVNVKGSSDGWIRFEKRYTAGEMQARAARHGAVRWALNLVVYHNPGTVWADDLELIDPSREESFPIYLSPDASDAEHFAAGDLSRSLERITGKIFPIRPVEKDNTTDPAIVIGPAPAGKAEKQEWILKSDGRRLAISGGDIAGTVYGVYEFLEKYAQCAWLDHETEIIPENPAWTLPQIDERCRPVFRRREFYGGFDPVFRLRNKENSRSAFPEANVDWGSPYLTHTMASYAGSWKEENLFALSRNGVRNRAQICLTNPEGRRRIVRQLKAYIAKDRKGKTPAQWPVVYDLSQNDGPAGECCCSECRKIWKRERAYSGVALDFINGIAEAVRDEYPEIFLRILAYSYTQEPPVQAVAADNVIIQSCNSHLFSPMLPGTPNGRLLEQWSKHAGHLGIWGYWKVYTGYEFPFVKSGKRIQEEFQFCRKYRALDYFAENEEPFERSFYQFQYWIGLKLMQNPDADVNRLTERFMSGYYGEAASPMREYLEYLEKRQAEVPYGAANTVAYLDNAFYRNANRLLDWAETLARNNPAALRHVRAERIPLDRSMLTRLAVLMKEENLLAAKEQAVARLEKNAKENLLRAKASLAKIQGQDARRTLRDVERKLAALPMEIKLYQAFPAPIPEQFRDKDIVDIHWNSFQPYTQENLVADADAVCGMAYHVPSEKLNLKKDKKTSAHPLPFEFGLYNWQDRKVKSAPALKRKAIPQDEKYHWYKVGREIITPALYAWFHWSWQVQVHMRGIGIVPEEMDVWASIKFTGPSYVKGSKKKDDVFVDRVILVRDR